MNSQGSTTMGRGPARAAGPTGRTGRVPFRKTSTHEPNSKRWRGEVYVATLAQPATYRCVQCGHGFKGRGDARRCCA